MRERSDWDLTEPIGRWSGQEGSSLATIDRKRQTAERERESAEGAWTEVAQEHESDADGAIGQQEWQMKTAARQAVREEAESERRAPMNDVCPRAPPRPRPAVWVYERAASRRSPVGNTERKHGWDNQY